MNVIMVIQWLLTLLLKFELRSTIMVNTVNRVWKLLRGGRGKRCIMLVENLLTPESHSSLISSVHDSMFSSKNPVCKDNERRLRV